MKNFVLSTMAVVLAITFTAFNTIKNKSAKEKTLSFIKETYKKKTNVFSWCVFEYIGGPEDSPSSYIKVSQLVYMNNYCPSNIQLCAIFAEEDLFNYPDHPTQESLNYLLNYFGFYYYFPYEVPGLIEFKWWR